MVRPCRLDIAWPYGINGPCTDSIFYLCPRGGGATDGVGEGVEVVSMYMLFGEAAARVGCGSGKGGGELPGWGAYFTSPHNSCQFHHATERSSKFN